MKDKNTQTIELSEEILRNIELSEIPLRNIVLKCARLARLTGNQRAMNLFYYELAGYPKDKNGYILTEAFELAKYANRAFYQKDKYGDAKEYMFAETIAELETELEAAKDQLRVASDRDISFASSNPYALPPMGNSIERTGLRELITGKGKKIDQLKVAYYNYVLGVFYELRFGSMTEDIFQRRKLLVDNSLIEKLPEALKKFVSVYENLRSGNQEDWANAVHSCRRILKDVADFLYPPSNQEIDIEIEAGKGKKIKLDDEHYIVRLKQYIKEKAPSEKLLKIVGSHLNYIGDRIDSIYEASTKGTHSEIGQEEAERYVIYTYLLLSDILNL